MPREAPIGPPTTDSVAATAAAAIGRDALRVVRIEEGLNAVYRIDLAGGECAVLKAATLTTDAELLAESALLSLLGAATTVPVPAVLATVEPHGGELDVACFLTSYCEGRRVTDVRELSPTAHERLVQEAGRHLAALHDVSIVDGFGNLRVENGDLVVVSRYGNWASWFSELATRATDGLRGAGYVTDDEGRFVDLEPAIRDALDGAERTLSDRGIVPSILHGDYRLANLVLAPMDEDDPITQAVLDFGSPSTGDGLCDLALAEDVLVDVPLGGRERANRLRSVLRAAYVDERITGDGIGFDGRYPYYRLYARTRRLGSFSYVQQFAWEGDPEAVANRWRSFVRRRIAEIQ